MSNELLTFIECDSCRSKPGSPTLCAGCLHNRGVILALANRADHDALLRRCYDAMPNPEHESDFEKRQRGRKLLQDLAHAIRWGEKCKHGLNAALCAQCQRDRELEAKQ